MRQPRTNTLSHRHVVLLAAVLALGACGGDPETGGDSADAAATADLEAGDAGAIDASEEAADGDNGAAAGDARVLPEWFPDDVYLPEGYVVAGAMDVGSVQRVELAVAGGNVAELIEQARAGMLAQGWTEGANTGESFTFTKGGRSAMLTVNERDDGGARVGYQFTTL